MKTPIIAVACALAFAGVAWSILRPTPAPPPPDAGGFAAWGLKPGGDFAPLRARAEGQQLGSWGCAPLVPNHEVCEIASEGLPTTGVPGRIRVLVDSTGRITALRFAPATGQVMAPHAVRMTEEWLEELQEMTDAWDEVDDAPAWVPAFERGTGYRTWRSPDARWLAATHADGAGRIRFVLLADNQLLDRFVAADPVRPLLLYEVGFEGLTDQKAIGRAVAVQLARGGEAAERLWR